MHYKKQMYLALLLVVSTLLLFSGCNQDDGNTLQLWHIWTDENRGVPIERAARRFEEANPGIRVVISATPNDPYKTRLRTVGAEEFPDVFHSWGGGWLESFIDAGFVADITNEVNQARSELNPALINNANFRGRYYGVPYIASTTILFYNKDIFNRFNLQVPRNFSELERVAEVLIANDITPFALANRTRWPGAQHFVLVSMRIGGGDIFTRAYNRQVPFTDPAFIQAGDMIIDMVGKGWFPSGANGMDWDTGQSRILFYTERAAMLVQTSGFMGTARVENRAFYDEKLALATYPVIEGGRGTSTELLAGTNIFSVSAHSRNPELARKLAIFLATDQELQQTFLNNGILAAKPGLNVTDSHVRTALDQLNNATFLQNFIDQTLSPEMASLHQDTTQALIGRTMTSQQVAAAMQQAIENE